LKRAVNLYDSRVVGVVGSPVEFLRLALAWVGRVPNYAWLTLILLTFGALSISTLTRSWEREREALANRNYSRQSVLSAREVNATLRHRTALLSSDPRVAEQAGQERLRLIRPGEVVIPVGQGTGAVERRFSSERPNAD
jgi:cell division protein FtsB